MKRMKALAALYHSPVVQNKLTRSIVSLGFKAAVGAYDRGKDLF
jgi:hypothetical protein